MAFIYGVLAGALTTLAGFALVVLLPEHAGWAQRLGLQGIAQGTWEWTRLNLGHSLWVFTVVLALYLHALEKLRARLRGNATLERVAQAEQLVDVWTSLFFGVGVIWTAIGMRGALIHALGDPAVTLAGDAAGVLQRMVEGGILLALSTTILGGIGGYLMRVVKVLVVGAELRRYYHASARASSAGIEAAVTDIQRRLAILSRQRRQARTDDALAMGASVDAADR